MVRQGAKRQICESQPSVVERMSMEHQEFLPRVVARYHGRRLGMSRTFPPATSWAVP